MFFNVPESGDDARDISSILNLLTDDPPVVGHFARVGRSNARGARALKVTLTSQSTVLSLMRHRQKLKGKNIYMNLDLTPKQQQLENQVWTDFKDRKSKGEVGIRVKYTNGTPRITSSTGN